MGYGKLFASCYTGSMIGAGPDVFAVWGYVVAHTIKCQVELNPPLLAFTLGCTVERVEAAIAKLCEPDPKSRNKDEGGRRMIKEGEFAYRVVSHDLYRQMQDEDERREYMRQYMRERREKQGCKPRKPSSTEVTQAEAVSRSSIQEAEAAPPTPSAATPPSPKPEEREITDEPAEPTVPLTIKQLLAPFCVLYAKDTDRLAENEVTLDYVNRNASRAEIKEAVQFLFSRTGEKFYLNELMPEIMKRRLAKECEAATAEQNAPRLKAQMLFRRLWNDNPQINIPALILKSYQRGQSDGRPHALTDQATLERAVFDNPKTYHEYKRLVENEKRRLAAGDDLSGDGRTVLR